MSKEYYTNLPYKYLLKFYLKYQTTGSMGRWNAENFPKDYKIMKEILTELTEKLPDFPELGE